MGDISEEIVLLRNGAKRSLKIGVGTIPQGYGGDPNMITPIVPWQRTLAPSELDAIVALSDVMLPGTDCELAPSRINIGTFFDDWISAPYPTQAADRVLILNGLKLLEAESQRRFSASFTSLAPAQRIKMVAWLANSQGATRAFFARFRYLLVGGYFTSDHGMQSIGYRGNIPLVAFPPVTGEAQQIIQEELAILGLL